MGFELEASQIFSQVLYQLSFLALAIELPRLHSSTWMIFTFKDQHPRFLPLARVNLSVPVVGQGTKCNGMGEMCWTRPGFQPRPPQFLIQVLYYWSMTYLYLVQVHGLVWGVELLLTNDFSWLIHLSWLQIELLVLK